MTHDVIISLLTAHEGVAQKRAIRLAESFNCYYANNWRKTLDCLREVPADKITNAFWDFFVSFHAFAYLH